MMHESSLSSMTREYLRPRLKRRDIALPDDLGQDIMDCWCSESPLTWYRLLSSFAEIDLPSEPIRSGDVFRAILFTAIVPDNFQNDDAFFSCEILLSFVQLCMVGERNASYFTACTRMSNSKKLPGFAAAAAIFSDNCELFKDLVESGWQITADDHEHAHILHRENIVREFFVRDLPVSPKFMVEDLIAIGSDALIVRKAQNGWRFPPSLFYYFCYQTKREPQSVFYDSVSKSRRKILLHMLLCVSPTNAIELVSEYVLLEKQDIEAFQFLRYLGYPFSVTKKSLERAISTGNPRIIDIMLNQPHTPRLENQLWTELIVTFAPYLFDRYLLRMKVSKHSFLVAAQKGDEITFNKLLLMDRSTKCLDEDVLDVIIQNSRHGLVKRLSESKIVVGQQILDEIYVRSEYMCLKELIIHVRGWDKGVRSRLIDDLVNRARECSDLGQELQIAACVVASLANIRFSIQPRWFVCQILRGSFVFSDEVRTWCVSVTDSFCVMNPPPSKKVRNRASKILELMGRFPLF